MDIKTLFENTTPEQRKKALQCKTAEELGQFAKDENIDISAEDVSELFIAIQKNTGEVSDDDLDNVAGGKSFGGWWDEKSCSRCGSKDYLKSGNDCTCNRCGWTWQYTK